MKKTILITGSTSGFGHELVGSLLKSGHKVIATGRSLIDRKNIFKNERERYPNSLIELNLDVTVEKDRFAVLEFIQKNGPLDVLVNNAGYGLFGPAEGAEEAAIRTQFETNVFGVMLLTRDLLPSLRQSKGLIINLASVMGFVGFPLASFYCATKYAIEGFTESLAYEMAPHGVLVKLVEPGGYGTNFNGGTQWTHESSNFNSPYFLQISNYKKTRDEFVSTSKLQDPTEVSQKLQYIIENPQKSPFRSTLGKDALFTRYLQAILPREIFFRLAQFFYTKTFRKKV